MVELSVGGRPFTATEIRGVGAEAIDRVELFGPDESRAEPGDHLVVIAQAFDESSEPIYGVSHGYPGGLSLDELWVPPHTPPA